MFGNKSVLLPILYASDEIIYERFGNVTKFSYFCGDEQERETNAEDQNAYIMHKPHPSNIIKGYIMRDILNFLIKNNYIK